MGFDQIQFPPNSTGPKADTWTVTRGADTRHQNIVRTAESPTYLCVYRLATVVARSSLSFALAANTDKQWATLHHAASATKAIRIRRVSITPIDTTAAAIMNFHLRWITSAPATGNPAITPIPARRDNAATEAVTLALPGTAGTYENTAQDIGHQEFDVGIGAATTAVHLPPYPIVLYNEGDNQQDEQPLILRPGVLEGVAVVVRSTVANTLNAAAFIRYTEEAE